MNTVQNNTASRCPVETALGVLGGKWKILILWNVRDAPQRYGELRRRIPDITERMLIKQLRELENDGLIHREQYPEVPPRVEYSLTDMAHTLLPVLKQLSEWAQVHLLDQPVS